MPTLEFKGKPFVYSHHLSVPFRELVVDPKKSLPAKGQKPSLDDNLIIHGDNLEALKALLPRYAGKVDVIYIDPPYNTGNERWAYNDNVNSPLMKEWLGKVVDRDDLERHDKWCCMMWPRLMLLKELLSPKGAIFISIDDGELGRLLGILFDVFGDHPVATIPVVNNMKGRNDKKNFARAHEYLACPMRLKDYQSGALDTLSAYLKLLRAEFDGRAQEIADYEKLPPARRDKVMELLGDPVAVAWNEARKIGIAASPDPWRPLEDGAGRSVPHVCLKLPTGGGKTLLAAHGVDRILVSHFRQTTGFVLWIVPSEAIYTQTKTQLADREHPIRQTLDRASGGRVKILEKLDGFTKQDVEQKLCVLLLMLPSANRENRETLKVFSDSGRYTSFFPQDDPLARSQLRRDVPNLEGIDLIEAALGGEAAAWIKQSLGNTLRIIRPIIVLDEGHRTYGELARDTLRTLNPRFILELTATPKREFSNILVNVSGRELKDEEMIKLPIRLEVGRRLRWQTTLQNAVDRLDELAKAANTFQNTTGRYIRPIMLVRVDRTGKDQREKGGDLVHSEDAFEFLTQKVGVPPEAIRRQTAEIKELKGDDLLSPYCGVRFILTKDALREGWDCPFAYVLAILSKGTAKTALTQMIGRVLRQPQAARTGIEALDEAHVFCADVDVGEAVKNIKDGLEAEGMGDLAGEIVTGGGGGETTEVEVRFREKWRGKRIMVPRVLHRDGKKTFRDLDYEADVLACVDFERLSYRGANSFPVKDYDAGSREGFTIDIKPGAAFGVEAQESETTIAVDQPLDRPGLIRRMLDVVPNPWQGARILDEAIAALDKRANEHEIIAARLTLVEHIKRDIQKQVEQASEQVFRNKVKSGEIIFKLLAAPLDLNYQFQEVLKFHIASGDDKAPLLRTMGPHWSVRCMRLPSKET